MSLPTLFYTLTHPDWSSPLYHLRSCRTCTTTTSHTPSAPFNTEFCPATLSSLILIQWPSGRCSEPHSRSRNTSVMQFLRFLFACIVLILCSHSATAIPQSLVLRQDDASSSRPNTPSVTTSFSSSATASPDNDASASTTESRHVSPTSVVSTSTTEAITSFQVPVTASAAPQSTSPAGELPERGHMRRMIDRV